MRDGLAFRQQCAGLFVTLVGDVGWWRLLCVNCVCLLVVACVMMS